jgi:hypothetical protein
MIRPVRAVGAIVALLAWGASCFAAPVAYSAGDSNLYRIDLETGRATFVGPMGYRDVEGLAFSPEGALFGVADAGTGDPRSALTDFLLRIDLITGAATPVGLLGLNREGVGPHFELDYGLAFTCDGRLWLSSDTTSTLWEVDQFTAATRRVGNLSAAVSGLAARGNELFGISVDNDETILRIDPNTALSQVIGPAHIPDVTYDAGLDFDANGDLWATIDYLSPPAGIPPLRNDLLKLDSLGGRTLEKRVISGAGADINTVQMEGLAIAPPGECPLGENGNDTSAHAVPLAEAWVLLLAALLAIIGIVKHRP